MRAGLTWEPGPGETGALVGPSGQPLATFHWGSRANHPYVDDLRPLAHRGVLTAHAPHDHRWHHGLWWSWKFVDDVLFWEDHPGYGGNRTGLGRSLVREHAVHEDDGRVRVTERLDWVVDATGEVLLSEQRVVTAGLDPVLPGAWVLDWDQRWRATREVVLSTTPWPQTSWGGYAGLSYRAARAMVGEEEVLASGDRRGAAAVHGERAAWAAYTGLVDGAEVDEPAVPGRGGVALLPHPDDEGTPHPVYAATATDGFGFLATAPLMHGDRTLAADEDLRLRTRVVVLPGRADPDVLDAALTAWSGRAVPA
ncbi:DUF6807 family protein [Quadrisphaera setariae]|uniref:Methane oxygenase PmoA n=1 Tax=Quadrisphaera setariae TaxID=2593304 RepID=A0A5C8ZIX4_9ACTN|nr:DUF6807 family protein [Quadrisphaera setariae]TXR58015.1 hypothetical protein FMM08_01985 [Quadrisphaera setariae]